MDFNQAKTDSIFEKKKKSKPLLTKKSVFKIKTVYNIILFLSANGSGLTFNRSKNLTQFFFNTEKKFFTQFTNEVYS